MNWLSGFIHKQAKYVLDDKRHAVLHTVMLALLPYTAWLSVTIIALVTLRKGLRDGSLLLASAIIASVCLSLVSTTVTLSLINAVFTFVPCYMAAGVLRLTVSWRAVAGLFLFQVILVVLFLQVFMPDFVMAQYTYLQKIVNEIQTESALLSLINDNNALNQKMLASYLLGLQAVGVVFTSILSLMCARSIQSQLFYPGEFGREMLSFRGDKLGLLLLVVLLIAANQQNVIAMSYLPIFIFYFLMAGLSLSCNVLMKHKPSRSIILLVSSLFLMPFIMLPVYVIFGSLDSLFNFRLYFARLQK